MGVCSGSLFISAFSSLNSSSISFFILFSTFLLPFFICYWRDAWSESLILLTEHDRAKPQRVYSKRPSRGVSECKRHCHWHYQQQVIVILITEVKKSYVIKDFVAPLLWNRSNSTLTFTKLLITIVAMCSLMQNLNKKSKQRLFSKRYVWELQCCTVILNVFQN